MKIRVWGAFVLLTLIWGASFLWIKIAVLDIGPFMLVALRMACGLLGLAVFVLVQRPALPRDLATWRSLVTLGLMNTAVPWTLISWAELSIDSALATVLNGTVPLFTIVLAHFFLVDDRMTPKRVVGLLLGFGGVILLSQRGGGGPESASQGVPSNLAGLFAMLGAAFLYGASGVYARRKLKHVSALVQAFFSMLVAGVLLWAALPLLEPAPVVPTGVLTWIAIAWLGVLGAGIASYLYYFALHEMGPTRISLVTYTIPVVGVTLGVVVLHERLDALLVSATLLIVSGVWVVNRR